MMNAFLRGNKIMEVESKLMSNENGAYWCFCVRYIEIVHLEVIGEKDSKKVLDEAPFEKFSKPREVRNRKPICLSLSQSLALKLNPDT